MTLTEEAALAQDAAFINRVAAAAIRKAVAISVESSAGLRPPRKALAVRVLKNPLVEAGVLAMLVARDAVIAALSPLNNANALLTDTLITNALSDAVWDGYAQTFTE